MRRMILGILTATFALVAPVDAQQPTSAPELVAMPAYAAVKGLRNYADPATYATAVADRRFRMERIAYQSDGVTVYAYVYRPVKSTGTRPTIVFNRGSWT